MTNSITVTIHTYNEEKNIEACIESAQLLSDQIQVVDMTSTDKTVSLAKKLGVEVYSFPYSYYVEPSRQFGIEKARTDWVFILDADERISSELAQEIKEKLEVRSKESVDYYTYFKIPRKNIFSGTWLRHGGWWPDNQIRLINTKYFKKWPKQIHSTPIIEGDCGFLKEPLLHYFHGDLEEMVRKTVIFEDIESDLLYSARKNVSTVIFFRKFLGELYRRLFKHFGFLDGTIGIIESVYQAFSKTITYLFLYEKKLKSRSL